MFFFLLEKFVTIKGGKHIRKMRKVTMNFDYIQDAKPQTEELQKLYELLYQDIEKAEDLYWSEPQKCGMRLRKATEKICKIYNSYYNIGFSESASLEDFLCYTDNETHNIMVSKFLSVVRQEQRDYLEWLRVWGDECVFMDEKPEEMNRNDDRLYVIVKRMMTTMMDVTKEVCIRLDHMEDLDDWIFEEHILPGYQTEEEKKEQEELLKKEEKKKKFLSFFKKG